jgi:hypothetical protein
MEQSLLIDFGEFRRHREDGFHLRSKKQLSFGYGVVDGLLAQTVAS